MAPTEQPVPGRKRKIIAWTVIGFIGFFVLAAALKPEPVKVNGFTPPDPPSASVATPAKTPAEKARDDAKTAKLRAAGAGALDLKRAAKDPETFEMKSVVLKDTGTTCYEYRAKNSFGAILPGEAVLTPKGKLYVHEQNVSAFVAAWNKDCTKAGGDEILPLLRQLEIL